MLLLLGAGGVGVAGCGDEGPGSAYDGDALCAELADQLRACSLLSPGEVDCGVFQIESYGRCASDCSRPASCEDIREQLCDDLDNTYALCIDRCQAMLAFVDCGDGSSVEVGHACDGENDCANGADEQDCPAPTQLPPEPMFACGDGSDVPEDYRCDGTEDCANAADEAGCSMRAEILCPGGF